jgi:hypothetical protein
MPDFFKTIKITQPTPGGPLVEQVVGAVQVSTGTSADAGKLVVLNATGQIDPSMGGGGGGSTVHVNGTAVSSPNFNATTPAAPGGFTNVIWQSDGSGNVSAYYATSGSTVPFGSVTAGTNAVALVVGSGGTLTVSGSGVIETTELATTGAPVNISNSAPPAHAGQLLISQPGNVTAVWADPLVQGLFTPGTNVNTGNSGGPINPVLIGGQNPSGLLNNILTDTLGNLEVAIASAGGQVVNGSSTTTPLGANATYTGVTINVLDYSQITVLSYSDQTSATNGLQIQYSQDSVNWNHAVSSTANASESTSIQSGVHGQYARIVYNNGTTPQGVFRLQTIVSPLSSLSTIKSLDANISFEDEALVVRAVLSGQSTPGVYTDVNTSPSGSLTVAGSGFNTSAAATWDSSTTNNTSLVILNGEFDFNTVGVTIVQTSTITGGAITFEGSFDNVNWTPVVGVFAGTGVAMSSATYSLASSTVQSFLFNVTGFGWFRARLSPAISGTGTVTLNTTAQALGNPSISITTGSISVSSNQGTPNTTANAWPIKVTDGTNTATVKPASTAPLATDSALVVSLSPNSTGSIAVTQYLDGTTNATPTGIVSLGKNASNVLHALSLDGTGNLNVDTQAAVFAAANNTADPASAVWIGGSDGTNLQGLQVESSSNKNLRVSIYQGGNEVNVSSNRLLVDSSGVTQPVSIAGTVLVSNTTQNYAQASTTSGQIGPLVQGAVTTNDPTYTTAQTSPLSLTTAGHLRSQDFATSSTGIAVPTKAMFIGGIGADGFLHGLSTDNSGILNVNASFSGTVTPGFVTDRVQSGSITSTQTVSISTYGAASVIFNITGSWTGTIQFQSQLADNSWVSATAYPVFIGGAGVTQTTANGEWQIPVGGMQAFRVIGNTVNSGTATANLEAGAGAYSMFVQQLSASDLNATVVQGTAGTQAQAWFVKVTDGTNPLGTSSNPFIVAGSKTNNNAAPGSNNVGVLPALANSSAPSYTDGDQVLLSVDTTGALRVSSSGTFTPALTADSTATGTITNTQNVTLSTQGTGTTLFNITGSWTGTIVFEASVDGVNFVSAKAVGKYPLSFPGVSQATANGQWAIPTGGLSKFRLRGANVTSGTATVWIEGGAGAQDMAVFAVITDPNSTNTPAVKAASTVPLATDQALVVTLSPNSSQFATSTTATTLPGSNPQTIGTSSSAVVNATAGRKEITITNTGTTVIFLGLGQTPTNTSYHVALAGCTVANDGTGSTYTSDIWKGSINAISSAGGGLVNVAELT